MEAIKKLINDFISSIIPDECKGIEFENINDDQQCGGKITFKSNDGKKLTIEIVSSDLKKEKKFEKFSHQLDLESMKRIEFLCK